MRCVCLVLLIAGLGAAVRASGETTSFPTALPESIEMRESSATEWILWQESGNPAWDSSALADCREVRLVFRIPESLAGKRLGFFSGSISSLYEAILDGEPIARKGVIDPVGGTHWTGRSEMFALPGVYSSGEEVVVTFRILSLSARGGFVGEVTPILGPLPELESLAQQQNRRPSYVLVILLTVLVMLLLFAIILISRNLSDPLGWAFFTVVAAECLDVMVRVAVLFDFPTESTLYWCSLAVVIWGFLSYPCWLVIIAKLSRSPIGPWLKRYLAASIVAGLAALFIGFREFAILPLATAMALFFAMGFFGGILLLIRAFRNRARYWKVLCFVWIAGHAGLLPDLANLISPGTISESGWWISPSNLSFLIPASFFAILILRRSAEDRLRTEMLTNRVLTSQEDERRRIARELHDGAVQNLQALKLQLQLREGEAVDDDERAALVSWLNRTGDEIRYAARNLHPSALEGKTLPEAIREWAVWLRRSGTDIQLDLDSCPELSPLATVNLFRIFQEAAANAIQHGEARRLDVSLNGELEKRVILVVKNDGNAWDPNETASGIGLQSIEERAELCEGTVTWQCDGRWTEMSVVVKTDC